MKKANELVQEYFAKPPIERVNTTVQDYVYDYQQAKIDAVLEYLSTCNMSLDVDIYTIKELLK